MAASLSLVTAKSLHSHRYYIGWSWLKADSVLVALFTSALVDAPLFRLTVNPSEANELASQIMVDKIVAVPREKCGAVIGHLDEAPRLALNQLLSVMLGQD